MTGFILYFLVHLVLVAIPSFTGTPFAPGDLSLRLADILLVAIGVPAAAVIAGYASLWRTLSETTVPA